jgi:hypothetical protein
MVRSFWNHQLTCIAEERFPRIFDKQLKAVNVTRQLIVVAARKFYGSSVTGFLSCQTEKSTAIKAKFILLLQPRATL